MSGGYPDAPEQRLAYDLDGTKVIPLRSFTFSTASYEDGILSSTDTANLNNEHNTKSILIGATFVSVRTQWHFPGPRDLFGCWAAGSGEDQVESFFTNVSHSGDTRSWNTGSWTDTGIDFTETRRIWDTWREEIETFNAEEQWGFRGETSGSGGLEFTDKKCRQVHIYGEPSPSAYPDRIIVLDVDTGLELNLHDWGYLPRGVSQTKDLQVRNNSTTHNANQVTLSFNSLNTHDPDTWHDLSDGGGPYQSALNIGNLAASTTYANTVTMRVTPITTAGMGPMTNRLIVSVASFGDPESPLQQDVTGTGQVTGTLFTDSLQSFVYGGSEIGGAQLDG